MRGQIEFIFKKQQQKASIYKLSMILEQCSKFTTLLTFFKSVHYVQEVELSE